MVHRHPPGVTHAAGLTAVVRGPFTAFGRLPAVPLMAVGVLFDIVMTMAERLDRRERRHRRVAGAAVGSVTLISSFVPAYRCCISEFA